MKKNQLIGLSLAAFTGAFMIQGCDLVKDIEYKVNPNPVEMHGDTVTLNINGKFVEKGLHKKAVVEVTPVIIGADGTEHPFKMEKFQGPKAADNGKVIPKEGGSFSYTSRIPYTADMEVAEVKVKILPKKGTKVKEEIVTDKIADGTIITPLLVRADDKVIIGVDKFQRVTSHTQEMVINYAKNRSEVRPGESKDADYKAFVEWVKVALTNERIAIKGVQIPAYASPEGEISLNSNLANERAETARKAVMAEAKKLKWEAGALEATYNLAGKGEDWEGFKAAMEKSSIGDKELILRVLTMYSDLNKREEEIRNMAKTYKEIEDKILPELRRSVVVLSYDLTGKTDAELTELAKSKPDSLTVEELLFSATLTNDLNEKLRIYNEAARIYNTDWRGANNAGCILFMQGKVNEAKAEFEKAATIASGEAIIKNNLAACARQMGDREKAEQLLTEASGAGPEVSYNMGIINIQKGKYGDAVSGMGSFNTFNKALAQVLNGDGSSASSTLDNSDAEVKESAYAYYLRAIIAARANNMNDVKTNLSTAISKDGALKEKASKDREFLKFASMAEFQNLVK